MSLFSDIFFGNDGGATQADYDRAIKRDPFSDFLPYKWWNEDLGAFELVDDTYGYAWEMVPVTQAGGDLSSSVENLLALGWPQGTILQVGLFADPDIGNLIERYTALKVRDSALTQNNAASFANWLKAQKTGIRQMQGTPLRNFRCFLWIKTPETLNEDLQNTVIETLKNFQIRKSAPGELMSFVRRVFSKIDNPRPSTIDPSKPLRKQIIEAGSGLHFRDKDVEMNGHVARCITAKGLPNKIWPARLNRLIGGQMGLGDDENQITGPFLFTVTVLLDNVVSALHKKMTVQGMQRGVGSFAPKIASRMDELSWAIGESEQTRFVRVIPQMWVFGKNHDDASSLASRARSLWESTGIVVQDESYLNKVLLVTALPFGLIDKGRNVEMMDRHFIMSDRAAAMMLPVQADFRGAGEPVLIFVGRKGQVTPVDLFDRGANNNNFVMYAGSGAGKSFAANYLLSQYYATNAKVRVFDIGGSYYKLCKSVDGRYMDFGKEAVVINPFDFEARDKDDIDLGKAAACSIIGLMATANSKTTLDEETVNLIKHGVRWVLGEGRGAQGIAALRKFLQTFPKHVQEQDSHGALEFLKERAHGLAYNLQSFDVDGEYGEFFNGPSTFNIKRDEFVVLELEKLMTRKDLFNVVTLSILNAVTQDLYLSDRKRQTIILQDEAAALIKDQESGKNSPFAAVYEAGYRRARKYRGSFGTVFQSPLDLYAAGDLGRVIRENSAFKFGLYSDSYAEAAEKGVLPNVSPYGLELMKSVRNVKPHYSEMFVDSPFGQGVTRLVVDSFTYWVNTSAPEEVAAFESLLKQGFAPADAIEMLAGSDKRGVIQDMPQAVAAE